MSFIYEAASLIVYKIPNPIHGGVRWMEHKIRSIRNSGFKVTIYGKEENLLEDILVHQARFGSRQANVRIFIPSSVHESNPNAWKHIVALKDQLDLEGLETIWAPCATNDRACSISYAISSKNTEPRLKDDRFRLHILDQAASVARISRSTHVWMSETHNNTGKPVATGYVQFDSPKDGQTLMNIKEMSITDSDNTIYDISFYRIDHHIQPSHCTTIFLYYDLQMTNFERSSLEVHRLVKNYNEYNPRAPASVFNIREIRSCYFLCDLDEIKAAYTICDYPMPGEEFFRPLFEVNSHGFSLSTIRHYNRYKLQQFEKHMKATNTKDGDLPPPRESFERYIPRKKRERVEEPYIGSVKSIIKNERHSKILVLELKLKKFRGIAKDAVHLERDLYLRKLKALEDEERDEQAKLDQQVSSSSQQIENEEQDCQPNKRPKIF